LVAVPRLWSETIETHRREVREAILDATVGLVEERGIRGVTMSQIAEEAGIGRATLYKYFPDVETILMAWHQSQIDAHLHQLRNLASHGTDPLMSLEAVLTAYALIRHQTARDHHGTDLSALVHQGEDIGKAEARLTQLVEGLIADAASVGKIRNDVAVPELAAYALHALSAAAELKSTEAAHRLVALTLAGMQPK
jgi:AcrR family transcriptional regulator